MAADVELGQVQRGLGQRQHRHFLVARGADQARIGEAAFEAHMALAVGRRLGERLAGAVDQLEDRARDGLAALERDGIGFDAVAVAAGVQADVADVEIADLVFIAEAAGLAHHRDVDAGLLQFLDAFDRQEGDVAAVRLVVGDEAALVNAGRQRVQAVQVPVADRALQAAVVGIAPAVFAVVVDAVIVGGRGAAAQAQHGIEQFGHAVRLDAQELHIDLGHVDRGHRQAAVLAGGQHHATAGEVERRRHGFRAHLAMRRGDQRGLLDAGQTGAQGDGVRALRLHVGK